MSNDKTHNAQFPIELSTSYRFPQFQGMLAGMASAFGRADADLGRAIDQSFNAGYLKAQQDACSLLFDAEEIGAIVALLTEDSTPLTDLMKVTSWEAVEEPVGGHGDDIKWSKGKRPDVYHFESSWAQEVFLNHLPEEVTSKIDEYFAEKGD